MNNQYLIKTKLFIVVMMLILASIIICFSAYAAEGEIKFLSAIKDKTGKWKYSSSPYVIYKVGEAGYGWSMRVSNQNIKKATITISAPKEVVNWPKGASITSDGQTGVFVKSIKPKKNYLFDLYVIADGDPEGRYSMTINIGNISNTFEFTLIRHHSTAGEYSVKELIDLYYQLAMDEKFLSTANPFKRGTSHYEIHRQFLKDMLQNERFVERTYEIIKEQENDVTDYKTLFTAYYGELVKRGMVKMNDSDKEETLRIYKLMLSETNYRECALFLRGQMSMKATYSILAKMNTNDFKRYYRILNNAVMADLNDKTEPTVSYEQQKIVNDALINFLINNLTKEQLERYYNISKNISSSSDEELCGFGLINLTGYLNLKGDIKNWAVRSYFNSVR